MATPPYRRRIPRSVVDQLIGDLRSRCCVCRVVIDPHRFDADVEFGSLEKHHLLYLSEGGDDSYENLLLVCANCHSQIHSHSEKYPISKLKEMKQHWKNMTTVVPSTLKMIEGNDNIEDVLHIHFLVQSVNLRYCVEAPKNGRVSDLTAFLRDQVLKPLGEYDRNRNWLNASQANVALSTDPETALDPDLPLASLPDTSESPLVALILGQILPHVRDIQELLESRIRAILDEEISAEQYRYRSLIDRIAARIHSEVGSIVPIDQHRLLDACMEAVHYAARYDFPYFIHSGEFRHILGRAIFSALRGEYRRGGDWPK